jgi:hypothetical protein
MQIGLYVKDTPLNQERGEGVLLRVDLALGLVERAQKLQTGPARVLYTKRNFLSSGSWHQWAGVIYNWDGLLYNQNRWPTA